MSNQFMKLYLYVEHPELKTAYESRVEKHNINAKKEFFDSGFDILNPDDIVFNNHTYGNKVNLGIVAAAYLYPYNINESSNQSSPCGFYIYPRSSISKTPIRLSNSTGIIDSGYRGNLMGVFDNISSTDFFFEKHNRLLQICGPGLCPIHVELVNSVEELGTTERGSGGFGSTGA